MKSFKICLLVAVVAVAFAAGLGLAPGLEQAAWAHCHMGDPGCTP